MAKLKTGRHTSAIKEHRKTIRRTSSNKAVTRKIRALSKSLEKAVSSKDLASAKKLLPECFSAWDKAAKIGLIHSNAASRKKARLSLKVQLLSSKAA